MKKMTAATLLISAMASSMAMADESQLGGFYVGANIGMAAPSMTVEDSDCWYNCSAYTQRPTGLTYGLQGGQNIISGNLLLGWVLDYNLASLDESFDYGYGNGTNDDMRIESEFKSAMSLRVKAGVVVGDTAIAVNFGPARAEFESTFVDRNGQLGNPANWDKATYDDSTSGFVFGVGVEHAFSKNLLVGLDISKYSFDAEQKTVIDGPTGTDTGSKLKFVNSLDTFRVSGSYKF
ncbi:MAG: outer membrane beta-barrel protein [Moraxellaceae bacterium]|nr:outer membrane beta-barrel protein [Moraxellaceae bacterium]